MECRCKCVFPLWPKGYNGEASPTVWAVVKYKDSSGNTFSATGIGLPTNPAVDVTLSGNWAQTKYGPTFEVTTYSIEYPETEETAVKYLISLRIGLGEKRAQLIYGHFGNQLWDIIENTPEKLSEVRGIPRTAIDKLIERMSETSLDRKILQLLKTTVELSAEQIAQIKAAYGTYSLEIIEKYPYRLCELGIGFPTAEKLGIKYGVAANDIERLRCLAQYLLDRQATSGHTCTPEREFLELFTKYSGLQSEVAKSIYEQILHERIIIRSNGMLYTIKRFHEESELAKRVASMSLDAPLRQVSEEKLDETIAAYEKSAGITLAPAQKEAVKNVFRFKASVITGGPGVGKTTVIQAIIYLHKEIYGKQSNPVLLSPTGRAARRMTEATGYPAQTIHSAVQYKGDDKANAYIVRPISRRISPEYVDDDHIDSNLIIIDEASMMDLYIANVLFTKIPHNCHVVIVGDPDQLPSVGYGNVLYELLRASVLHTVKLTEVYRQGETSPIITNSIKIRNGETDLITDAHFKIAQRNSPEAVFNSACKLYLNSIQKFGMDNCLLLCPYRTKSDINVNMFNQTLQSIINPLKENTPSITRGKITFRAGDRVMQMRNTTDAVNGDVGYVKAIDVDENGEKIAIINFDGHEVTYTRKELQDVDLAYCTTVHKAQGSEAQTVICVLTSEHTAMLKRNVLYTAITRAKENVAIIEDNATVSPIEIAVKDNKTTLRWSQLSSRVRLNTTKK